MALACWLYRRCSRGYRLVTLCPSGTTVHRGGRWPGPITCVGGPMGQVTLTWGGVALVGTLEEEVAR